MLSSSSPSPIQLPSPSPGGQGQELLQQEGTASKPSSTTCLGGPRQPPRASQCPLPPASGHSHQKTSEAQDERPLRCPNITSARREARRRSKGHDLQKRVSIQLATARPHACHRGPLSGGPLPILLARQATSQGYLPAGIYCQGSDSSPCAPHKAHRALM